MWTLTWMIGLLLILLAIRVPVVVALFVPSLLYIALDPGAKWGVAAQQTISGVDSFPLLAVPMFILLGNIANVSGVSDKLFDAATALFGRVRGSLGYVSIASSFGFSWMSGAAISDAAALGRVQVPAMTKRGYSSSFATGITASASLIAPILPPSLPAIIYGVVGGVSVGALFVAGIVPALVLVTLLTVTVWWMMRKRDDLRLEPVHGSERWIPVLKALPPMGAAVIVLGGILGGAFTPTEAAGIGVAYMLVLSAFYRALTWKNIKTMLRSTAETSGVVMLIVAASALFGWVLTRERAPQLVAEAMLSITTNPVVFLLLLNILLLIVGAFMDVTPAILILVPLIAPMAGDYGLSPIHLGIVIIFNLLIGLLTPPVGLVLFVLSSVTGVSVQQVTKGVLPFFIPLLGALVLITYFPFLATWLPGLLGMGG
ncbi:MULTISPECIES: TRAP transporter large permease [Microbacterium]|uniref:TRAP transporter large permease n=1 Tax=Microbacterium TaxID=33882 RepID=UPI00051A54C3|nr:TRAP transporter large permease [Microbacterium profundi]